MTSYSEIYNCAIFKFQDNSLFKFTDEERDLLLEKYLFSAIAKFYPVCKINLLDRDDTNKRFNQTLDEECIEILGLGISFYWLSSKALNIRLLRNNLSTKDFSTFSNANLLKEVCAIRDTVKKEFLNAITSYSYRHGDLTNLEA